jgi:isoleucyl-tRNA synthetase
MFKQNFEKIGYPEIEKKILKFWTEHKIFEKSVTSRDENRPFTFMKDHQRQTVNPEFIMSFRVL